MRVTRSARGAPVRCKDRPVLTPQSADLMPIRVPFSRLTVKPALQFAGKQSDLPSLCPRGFQFAGVPFAAKALLDFSVSVLAEFFFELGDSFSAPD
jgi:hypothetical protein